MTGGCPAIDQAPFLYGRREIDKGGGCQNPFTIYNLTAENRSIPYVRSRFLRGYTLHFYPSRFCVEWNTFSEISQIVNIRLLECS